MTTVGATVKARAWVATSLGDPTAVMERRDVDVAYPGPNQIRVAVDAFCLNFNDIDIIRGRYLTLPLEMVRTGRLRPAVTRELTFDAIPTALEDMEQRRTMGRLVVRVGG